MNKVFFLFLLLQLTALSSWALDNEQPLSLHAISFLKHRARHAGLATDAEVSQVQILEDHFFQNGNTLKKVRLSFDNGRYFFARIRLNTEGSIVQLDSIQHNLIDIP